MGARSRRKGAAFEREVANALSSVWPAAERGLGQARDAKGLADVEGTPFHVQCKHGARPNIIAALTQADVDRSAPGDGRPALVVTRRDRGETLVTMRLVDWLTWVKAEVPSCTCAGPYRANPCPVHMAPP